MTWTWLFVWNVSWLIFALLYVSLSLETKFGGGSSQGDLGRNKLKRHEVEALRKCRPVRVRALRVHRCFRR